MESYFIVHEGFRRNLIDLEKTRNYINNVLFNGLLPYRNFSSFKWKNGIFFYKKTNKIEVWANSYIKGHMSIIVSFDYFLLPTSKRFICIEYICPDNEIYSSDEYFEKIVNYLDTQDAYFQWGEICNSELIACGHFSMFNETNKNIIDLSVDIENYSKFVDIINDLFYIKYYIDDNE